MSTDDARPALASGPTLLVGDPDASLGRLLEAGAEPLVAVACGGRSEQLLRRTVAAGADDVALLEVGARTRSAAGAGGAGGAGGGPVLGETVVTAVPRDDLDRIGGLVDDALGDRPVEGAVHVDGAGLVSTLGVGATYDLFERLCRRHRPGGPWVCGSLPDAARGTTVAGLAPLFDGVAGVGPDGELRPPAPPAGDVLPEDRRLDLLRHSRRRALLRTLATVDGPVGVDRLAALVADRLEDPDDRLRLLLFQTDLPKLDEHGVVAFDADERAAALRPQALQLWPLLSATDRR